jgi:hypothetical protein
MNRLSILLLLWILAIALAPGARAQQYPVQVSLFCPSPHPVNIPAYAPADREKLVIHILSRDLDQSEILVVPKISITGDGVSLRANPNNLPPPLVLRGGEPLRLSGLDIASWLDPTRLLYQGPNPALFLRSGRIPEGVYRLTLELVEYRRGHLVSAPASVMIFPALHEPPLWNLPQQNAILEASMPQSAFFSWTSRCNEPGVQVEISIWEVWPAHRDHREVMTSSPPLVREIVQHPSFVLGPVHPALVPGRRHVARLKAFIPGQEEAFRDGGLSVPLLFTYGRECPVPAGLSHAAPSPFAATLSLVPSQGQTAWEVDSREMLPSGQWGNWYPSPANTFPYHLQGLKPSTRYQYRAKAWCGTLASEHSTTREFTTLAAPARQVECGPSPGVVPPDGSPPLLALAPGETFTAGGFEALVTAASLNPGGTFTGRCIVHVPTFGIRVKATFEGITINQSRQLTSGEVIAERGSCTCTTGMRWPTVQPTPWLAPNTPSPAPSAPRLPLA